MTHSGLQQEGFIRVHGPWLPGVFRFCKNRWDPLQVHIDGQGAGLLGSHEIRTVPVEPGTHEVRVRWARKHHIRSPIFAVEVPVNETIDVVCAHPRLVTMGLSKLRLATDKEIARS
jgi:hypothetical protein